jgi:hypothetical protein
MPTTSTAAARFSSGAGVQDGDGEGEGEATATGTGAAAVPPEDAVPQAVSSPADSRARAEREGECSTRSGYVDIGA